MIIKIKVAKLMTMIKNISGIIKEKKNDSIFSYILIKIIKYKIFCIAINSEIEIVTYSTYENYTNDADIIINFESILEICKKNRDDADILIKKNKHSLEIKVEDLYVILPTIAINTFPSFKFDRKNAIITKVKTNVLSNLLSNSTITLTENNTNNFLNGILMDINENFITVFTSDGNRFTFAYDFIENNTDQIKVILTKQLIMQILNNSHYSDYFYIMVSKTYIRFINECVTITFKLTNEIYQLPDLLIKKSNNYKLNLNRKDTKNIIIKMTSLIKDNKITLSLKKNKLQLFSINNYEKAFTNLPISNLTNINFEIDLNYKYLVDTFKYVKNDTFDIYIFHTENFLIIKEKYKKYIYSIFPI